MIPYLRAIGRFLGFVGLSSYHVIRVFVRKLFHPKQSDVFLPELKNWSLRAQKLLGIQVSLSGELPDQEVLLVPNHRSYIDIALLPPYFRTVFVAKSEVRRWPIIGQGGRLAHTIWVQRDSAESRRQTREDISKRLAEGFSVIVYPEGTTVRAPELKSFRPGMFYRAAEAQVPVVPVAIEYGDIRDAWTGTDTFVGHFLHCFRKKHTVVRVKIGPVMYDTDGERLRSRAQSWVAEALRELQTELGLR